MPNAQNTVSGFISPIHSYQIGKTWCNISPGIISDTSVVTFDFNTVDIRLQNAVNHRENVCNLWRGDVLSFPPVTTSEEK